MRSGRRFLVSLPLALLSIHAAAQDIGNQDIPWKVLGNPSLDNSKRARLRRLFNDIWNYGGCGGPVAYCLNAQPKDSWTLRTARAVMRMVDQGMSDGQITIEMMRRDASVNTKNVLQFNLQGRPRLGDPNAPVTIVVWSDFQCPACKAVSERLQRLFTKYKTRVCMYYKHFPLPKLHPRAIPSALAAIAAGSFGKFWEMHDLLFKNAPSRLSDKDFLEMASSLGIDRSAFKKNFSSSTVFKLLEQDIKEANKLGLDRTPLIYFNGKRLIASKDFQTLCDRVEEELDLASTSKKQGSSGK